MQRTLTGNGGWGEGNKIGSVSLADMDWEFKSANTGRHTHGLHRYPARMIPQIPETLFSKWLADGTLSPGDSVFDPFSGSGTTPAEARLHGLNAVGTDINPFAALLARAKAHPGPISQLKAAASDCLGQDWATRERFIDSTYDDQTRCQKTRWGEDIDPEDRQGAFPFPVREGWFPERQLAKIDAMRRHLSELRGEYGHKPIRFLRVALSQAAREISYQRKSEFKRHRIPTEERADHEPAFTPLFRETVVENIGAAEDYVESLTSTDTTADIRLSDCRDTSLIEPNSQDAVVCSPPYGDHSTTVAYGQFSRAPAAAATPICADDLQSVDPSGLGGTDSTASVSFEQVVAWSDALSETLEVLKDADGRDEDVLTFFVDYAETIMSMERAIKPDQPVAIVIGNRTVSRTPIPSHLITTEIAEAVGLSHSQTLPRSIPSKKLPLKNAPENIPGATGETIADEYVLIFEG